MSHPLISFTADGPFTNETTVGEVEDAPLFAPFGRLLFPTTFCVPSRPTPLANLDRSLPWYSEVEAQTTLDVLNYLYQARAAGDPVYYPLYTSAEIAADPSLANTGLIHFSPFTLAALQQASSSRSLWPTLADKPQPQLLASSPVSLRASAPFSVVCAGGGFAYVAAIHDSFPHCLHLARAGCHGFAIIYRPQAQLACEDLARALSVIFDRASQLGVDTAGYGLWGGSAGARMATVVGGYGPRAFGSTVDEPPVAVIMQYTSYSAITGHDPATYACVGTRDSIAPWQIMRERLQRLSAMGVPCEFHAYPGLGHGFGLGVGTCAEGWIDDALAFWLAQRKGSSGA